MRTLPLAALTIGLAAALSPVYAQATPPRRADHFSLPSTSGSEAARHVYADYSGAAFARSRTAAPIKLGIGRSAFVGGGVALTDIAHTGGR